MRKTLRYSIMCVLMLLSYLPAMAQDVTIDFTKETVAPAVNYVITHNAQGFTFTFSKEKGVSAPKHMGTSSRDVRLYAKNKMVIESETPFNKVVFNISQKGLEQWGDIAPSQGDMPKADKEAKTATWTAPSPVTRIEFTVSDQAMYGTRHDKAYAGQFCFNSAVITKATEDTEVVESPVFSHTTGNYFAPFQLNITAPEGYTIRYTLNESNPSDVNGETFTAPITISNFTTVKAIAFNPSNKKSFIVTHTYTFPATRNSIAEIKVLSNKEIAKLVLKDAIVLAAGNDNMFVADESGAIMFYKTGLNYAPGTRINGTLVCKFDRFNNLPEIISAGEDTNDKDLRTTAGTTPAGEPATLGSIKAEDMLGKLVKIDNVQLDSANNRLYAVVGEERIEVYNKTLNALPTSTKIESGSTNNTLTAIVSVYNTNYQLLPISIETVTTGINNVNAEVGNKTQEAIYNLAGQRVDANYKGVVVKNGKKYLQK